MTPIPSPSALRAGDVLHHPAFGFAIVERADDDGVALRWERQGASHPVQVGGPALAAAYKLCHPRGLFSRSVRDPDGARALVGAEPLAALALLLCELDGPQSADDVRDWMLERRLFAEARFAAWWQAVLPLAEADDRFVVRRASVALREGLGVDALLEPAATALPSPGTLPPAAAFAFALKLARALAAVHAAGAGVVPIRHTVEVAGDGVRFRTRGAPTSSGRRDDVRFAMRLVLEQVLGPLPHPGELPEEELCAFAGALAPQLAPELLAVAADCLAGDPFLRPADGLVLWERLVAAQAAADLRAQVGWVRDATCVAGFNSHVGLLKSLQSQTNQDAFLLVGDPGFSLLAVCDGISQSTAGSGDLASALTARALRTAFEESADALRDGPPAALGAFLEAGLVRANQIVCEAALRLGEGDLQRNIPMGTTAVCALTRGNRVHLAALGDSRAYLVGRHGVAPLLADQNLTSLRLRDHLGGQVVPWHDIGHALVGYVGHFDEDERPTLPPPFSRVVDLLPGEWLVLCSDGLSDYAAAEDAGVGQLVAREAGECRLATPAQNAMELCRRLVDAANRGGGGDNVTVLALTLSPEYGSPPSGGPVPS
ncbi:MAG: PP2C family protein-serine/threonine phosphatase [Myxococcota bacterium]